MMERPAKNMTIVGMSNATHFSKRYTEEVIEEARNIENDTQRAERKAQSLCKACFYRGGRVGGATLTSQPCMSCGEIQHYGSTATDALCLECAKKHELCKQCGGDRELRERRRNWPVADNPTPA